MKRVKTDEATLYKVCCQSLFWSLCTFSHLMTVKDHSTDCRVASLCNVFHKIETAFFFAMSFPSMDII